MNLGFANNGWSCRAAASALLAAALALSACQSASNMGVRQGLPQTQTPQTRTLTPNPNGEVFGQGNVRVSLLLPKTAPGNAAKVATELRNGALMAMQDFGRNSLQLVVKDTTGQAAGAQAAAREAVAEGSSLVVGPLFAANVTAAAGMTVAANVPVIAFSTDSSVARRGIYLLSYTPEDDTRRMITYAGSIGRRSILAFLPNNAEGAIRENVLRQVAGSTGIQLQIAKYARTPEDISRAVGEAAASVATVDSIYIPEGGPVPKVIWSGLQRNGVSLQGKQLLGSGTWESVNAAEAIVAGALYPGLDLSNFSAFASRYQQTYGTQPGVQAALGYDAVTLAAELLRLNGPQRAYAVDVLESNRGFQGTNGIFRFRRSGTTERGLAIYQISNGQARVVSPAPTSFSFRGGS